MFIYTVWSEKAVAPHSSTFAWKIPWTEKLGRLQSMGSLESDTTERLHFHFSLSCTGEGNGNPLQCSCLENPRVGEAWWAAVYGVTQSRTRLKRLSSSSSVHCMVVSSVNAYCTNVFLVPCKWHFFKNINLFILIGGELLYNIVLVLPYINMNPPQVYTCSPS